MTITFSYMVINVAIKMVVNTCLFECDYWNTSDFWLMIYDPFFLNNNVIKQWHGYRPDPTSIPAFHHPDMVMDAMGQHWVPKSSGGPHHWPPIKITSICGHKEKTGGRYTSPDIPDPHSIIDPHSRMTKTYQNNNRQGQGRGPHLQALQLGCCDLTKGGPMSWWFQGHRPVTGLWLLWYKAISWL